MNAVSVRESFAGKHILLTGASGFVGKVWLAMILAKVPEVERIYVLVRPKKGLSARARYEALLGSSPAFRPLHEQYGARLPEYLSDKLEILEGDVASRRLGLSESAAAALRKNLDLLVHCAALVNFEPDLREAIGVNVKGALNALEFAQSCDHGRFLQVSTAFVCGRTSGELVDEILKPNYAPDGEPYDAEAEFEAVSQLIQNTAGKADWVQLGKDRAQRRNWPNAYTYSKSLAESLVQNRVGKLPFTILRPAIVESAVDFPFPGWNEGGETCTPISYLAASWLRHFTARPKLTLDIIPVDTVARGIAVAGAELLNDRHAPVYHCASSHKNPLAVGRMLELMGLAHRKYYREHGKDVLERQVLSRWDSVTVGDDNRLTAGKLKEHAAALFRLAKNWEAKAPEPVKGWLHPLTVFANQSKWTLVKAEKIMQVFQPFIYETDYRFLTDHLANASVEEEEFRFRPEAIDWRDYILNIHEPGIRKWCFPILENKPVEKYCPEYPFRLLEASERERHDASRVKEA